MGYYYKALHTITIIFVLLIALWGCFTLFAVSNPETFNTIRKEFKMNLNKKNAFSRQHGHWFQGTETILSDENASLKKKIKDLEAEVEHLRSMNIRLGSRLQTVRRIVCYDETDMEIDD
jgi:cell shape-determining protein MreC